MTQNYINYKLIGLRCMFIQTHEYANYIDVISR